MPRLCIWNCVDKSGEPRTVPDNSEHEACSVCRARKKRYAGASRSWRRQRYAVTGVWHESLAEAMKEKNDAKHERLDAAAEKEKAKRIAAAAIEKARANGKTPRTVHAHG